MGQPVVSILMGSRTDWEIMQHASTTLDQLGVPHEVRILSAHRAPDLLFEFTQQIEARGIRVIIAGAGGAAHLPGMLAAKAIVPVLGVPIASTSLGGLDALLAIVQMPGGIPVGTLAIGKAGAVNAALLASAMLALTDDRLRDALRSYRDAQTRAVAAQGDPRQSK